jgi:hypothetical protein
MSTGTSLQEIRMKVSREQAAQNRERIVETAAQLFRERGFEGIGVAERANEAALKVQQQVKTEGHQHVRNIGRRHGHGACCR